MQMDQHKGTITRITPGLRGFTPKPWGWEDVVTNSKEVNYCLKEIFIKAGYGTSMHRHPVKDETIMVLEGSLIIEHFQTVATGPLAVKQKPAQQSRKMRLGPGEAARIEPDAWHRLTAPLDNTLLVEASTYHDDNDKETMEEENVPTA